MKNIKLCPICNYEIKITDGYFAFPKLPSNSHYAWIWGNTHLNCLRFHPQKIEIQNELTKIYLQILENHPVFTILARSGNVLVKNYSEHQELGIYDFEYSDRLYCLNTL